MSYGWADLAECGDCGADLGYFRRLEDGRHCPECGADLVGNDPHEPDCVTGAPIDEETGQRMM